MSSEAITIVLSIIGGVFVWTSSIIGGAFWLSHKFRELEKTIYREKTKIDEEVDVVNLKVQRLEMKVFGFSTPELLPPWADRHDST